MEEYISLGDSSAASAKGNFLYTSPVLATASSVGGNFVIRSSSTNGGSNFSSCFAPSDQGFHIEKDESGGSRSQQEHVSDFQYHMMREFQVSSGEHRKDGADDMKAKIISHSQFSNLLQAFLDCQKVGAPAEVVAQLASATEEFEERWRSSMASNGCLKDPELDQFMEAYCGVMVKYGEELKRPIQEAADFMHRIQSQLQTLCNGALHIFPSDYKCEGIGWWEEEEAGDEQMECVAEERELKKHLLRKYSGYLSSLKQELSKKKKKSKLPKSARDELLRWWDLHNKWPYPSEAEKVALAELTGLDQKQINNWFINQRKRHWKPSEDIQFMAMDSFYNPSAAFYIDRHYMADAHYRLAP